MNIKGIINGVVFGVTSLLPVSCDNKSALECLESRESLLEEVMLDKTQTELNDIKAKLLPDYAKVVDMQHCIDSVVFRDMFQGTQLVKDSAFVSDYNKMMSKTKTPSNYSRGAGLHADFFKLRDLLAEQLTDKEMKNVMKSSVMSDNGGKGYFGTDLQYLVDSVYHHKLFEKYNLLDKNGLKKFKNLCRKVRP